MELQRTIYQELLRLREKATANLLKVNGARQTGKTYIVDKFARENYETYIYININMVQSSGKAFVECIDSAKKEWKTEKRRKEMPLYSALKLFDENFEDCKDAIVVIDEIQDSTEVLSVILEFAKEFETNFVMIGSYPEKLFNNIASSIFVGEIDTLSLATLSFEEFLMAVDKSEIYRGTDLFDIGLHEQYGELKSWYNIYCQIGGYPAVVNKYIEKKDIVACKKEIAKIIKNFMGEFECHSGEIIEVNLLEQVLLDIVMSMIKSAKMISNNQIIEWLYASDVIGYAEMDKIDSLNPMPNGKFFFKDMGVCRYFLEVAGVSQNQMRGVLDENFRYINLRI